MEGFLEERRSEWAENRTLRVNQAKPWTGERAGWAWDTPQCLSTLRPAGTGLLPTLSFQSPSCLPEVQPQIRGEAERSQTREEHQLPIQWNYSLCPEVAAFPPCGLLLLKQHRWAKRDATPKFTFWFLNLNLPTMRDRAPYIECWSYSISCNLLGYAPQFCKELCPR